MIVEEPTVATSECTESGRGLKWLTSMLIGPKLGAALILFLGLLILGSLITDWDIDEGAMLMFTYKLQETGELRYINCHSNAIHCFGSSYFYLLSVFQPDPLNSAGSYYLFRIPSLLCCLVTLLVVHQFSVRFFSTSRILTLMAMLLFVACCVGLKLLTARYDSPYMFGIGLAILSIVKLEQGKSWWWYNLAVAGNVFAVTCHPNGLAGLLFVAVVGVYFASLRWPSRGELVQIVLFSSLCLAAMVPLLLLGRSPAEWFRDLKAVGDEHHTFSLDVIYKEISERFYAVYRWYGLFGKLYLVSFAIAIIPWPLREKSHAVKCIWIGLLLCSAFLTAQPAKWATYVALTLPFVCVLAVYRLQVFLDLAADKLQLLTNVRLFAVTIQTRLRTYSLTSAQLTRFAVILIMVMSMVRLGWELALDMRQMAQRSTLFCSLVRPSGKQAQTVARLNDEFKGKKVSGCSDGRIVPLLNKLDYEHFLNPIKGQENPSSAQPFETEYMFFGTKYLFLTWDRFMRCKFDSCIPRKVAEATLFGERWLVYEIPGRDKYVASGSEKINK